MALPPALAGFLPSASFLELRGRTSTGTSRPSCCGHSRVLCVSMCPCPHPQIQCLAQDLAVNSMLCMFPTPCLRS